MKTRLLKRLRKDCDRHLVAIKNGYITYVFVDNIFYKHIYAVSKTDLIKQIKLVNIEYIVNRIKYMRMTNIETMKIKFRYYPTMKEILDKIFNQDMDYGVERNKK